MKEEIPQLLWRLQTIDATVCCPTARDLFRCKGHPQHSRPNFYPASAAVPRAAFNVVSRSQLSTHREITHYYCHKLHQLPGRWGCLIAMVTSSIARLKTRVPGAGRVVFAVNIGCRRWSFAGEPSMYSTHSAEPSGMAMPTSRQGTSRRAHRLNASASYHAVAPAVRSKSSPVLSIACIVTASLQATATAARLKPILSRRFRPHVRRRLSAELRVRMTVAAS